MDKYSEQPARAPDPSRPDAELVLERLTGQYGPAAWKPSGKPVDELVATILSQNTSDTNTERSFSSLTSRFQSWKEVRDAPIVDVADAIRAGGLADQKAPRIQQVLRKILADDASDQNQRLLRELRSLELSSAMAELTSLPGVGPKTAACVLLFAAGMPALPVDTHVYRVSQRIGLIGPKTDPNRAHEELRTQIAADDAYRFHVHMIKHGREICRARKPKCETCVVSDICQYRRGLVESV